MLRNKN